MPRAIYAGHTISDLMQIGKTLLACGFIVMLIGAALTWAPWLLAWFGRLPGDIRIERENFRLYFPITSMILASIVLSLLMRLPDKS